MSFGWGRWWVVWLGDFRDDIQKLLNHLLAITVDILHILRTKIESLEHGAHSIGLAAVLTHVSVAAKHLERGQRIKDDSAFTDAVYRCNQAFEGSTKEAYRVLANKDPEKVRPFDIENYLEDNHVFHSRVLALFTHYRREWRNPSTHDYTLSFTESEAFVAITSVATFSTVLCDEILGCLAFRRAQSDPELLAFSAAIAAGRKNEPPVWQLAHALVDIGSHFANAQMDKTLFEAQYVGLVAGMLSSGERGYKVEVEKLVDSESRLRADIVVRAQSEELILEVKRTKPTEAAIQSAIQQVEVYLTVTGLKSGLIFFTPIGSKKYELYGHTRQGGQGMIIAAYPK